MWGLARIGNKFKYRELFRAQRFVALFLFVVLVSGSAIPPLSVYAANRSNPIHALAEDKHKSTPVDTKTEAKKNYPGSSLPTKSASPAAADAAPASGALAGIVKNAKTMAEPLQGVLPKPKITPHELTNKRTANTTTSVNADGTLTEKRFFTPQFFQKDGKWANIDTTLTEDKNAGDSGNIIGQALGTVESWLSSANNFQVTENDWQARFSPSDSPRGMVRIKKGSSQIGFSPVGAKKVAPVITTDKDGRQVVHYYDLWPGVTVDYTVETAALKENVIIKDKTATSSVSFKLSGATLQKRQADATTAPDFAIKGALGDDFAVAPANLILNNFGFVTEAGAFSQTYKNDTITLAVDANYLKGLPDKAFPAVIDPGVFDSNFGTRASGNYMAFKSDGYICYYNQCNLYAGSLYDSNNYLRYWRGAFFAPYDQFRNSSNILTHANLHLQQRSNESFWTGTWDTHTYYVGHATCLNNFGCLESNTWNAAGTSAGSGNIDVTNIYQAMISRGDFGAWLMVGGEDGTTSSYKNFDPGNGGTSGSYVSFTYGGPPTAPSVASPSANQVYVDPQPSFKVSYVQNPNGSTPLKYEILVSTGSGASGGLIASGLLDTTQWTIPDGILQDGSTYYVQARSWDPITGTSSNWGDSVPFRIDMRTGKDSTQTFDSVGPVSVDLATGNLTTSAASHTSSALGGSLGVSLDYNSPLKSRNGLVGRYWNVPANYPGNTPTTDPLVMRVDQNVDFNWDTGSPSAGAINNDWFFSRWDGFFVAPATGTYYFGGNNDDLLVVTINNQQVYSNGGCYSGVCYGSSITLTAGQVVPIQVEHEEAGGPAYAHMYVKGPVDEQVVPQAWLQTGVRPVSNRHGLTASYYGNYDHTGTFSANNGLLMKRTDNYLNFDWGTGAPMPGGPDGFLVRWSGYVTVPTTGTYNFGVRSDDGAKIMLGTANTPVYNEWVDRGATEAYGSGYALTANTPTPITIEYYDAGGPASFQLKVQGAVAQQMVPPNWLTPSENPQVLPDGWSLGIDPDGNLNYDRLKVNQNSAVLTDSTGDNHEYTWNGTSYKPPVNEDGQLVRNADGTFTLQDTDGRTYVFGADGTLTSVTDPVDDRQPAALKYVYGGGGMGPAMLTQITDAVDTSRWAKVYYSGSSECGAAPSTFDAIAPTNMLCAVKTNDGRASYFYYRSGQLARVAQPGNLFTDYSYEQVSNNGVTIGYRLTGIRGSLAMDVVAAGGRTADATVDTQVAYDTLGRVTGVTAPAATAGATRMQQTIEYLPGALDKSYYGLTKEHVVGDVEPNGFTRAVKYDNLFRTVQDTDVANLAVTSEWDITKDLLYSTTDPTGMKSTNVYDDEDRPITSYGPAPKEWFDATNPKNQTPFAAYASQVPRSDANYDEGIVGPAVAWYDYTKQASNTSGVLSGAPKLHTTGINTTTPGTLSNTFTSPPITVGSGAQGIGLSATGRLRLANGTYTVSADTSDGIRLWVNDTIVIDGQWIDSGYRTVSGTFQVTNSEPKRFRLDVYRRTGSTGTLNVSIQQQGGFATTTDWSGYLKPDYSLPTSSKMYDSQLGNITNTTGYGTNPELALGTTTTADPSGLNLTANSTYETQGASGSFLRQTSKNLPGNPASNPSFSYSYYGATETRDNPCTTATEAYKQAGFLKFKTEADPDGAGSQSGRKTENVYDDAGRIVATRYNTDAWTCNTYDSRGRSIQTVVPAFGGEAARTVQSDYAVSGDPLETTTWDSQGWLVTWSDLLGRTVKYRDVANNETTTSYDVHGRLAQRVSPLGTETYEYDNYNRLTNQKLDNTTYATVYYDQSGRTDHIEYLNAGSLKSTVGRDTLGRMNALSYNLTSGGPGPNKIANPSVDQVASGNPNAPDQWTSNAWGTNTATFSYPTDAHTGSHSVKAQLSSFTDGDAKWYFNPVDAAGSTNYTFSDYYKSNAATNAVAQFTDAAGTNTYQWLGDLSAASSWTQTTYNFTTPATTTKVSVFHVIAAVGWLQLDDADLHETNLAANISDTLTRSQSGRIQTDVVQSGSNSLWSTYSYDGASRLTGANIGPHTYSYGFGAQNSACGTGNNRNPNAGKNGNRTSQTIDGVSNYYCYDFADRLVGGSDSTSNYAEYDSHGNMTYMGTNDTPLRMCYDSSDRNWCLVSYSASTGNGTGTYYGRDAQGRIQYREQDNITAWNWSLNSANWYGFTGTGDSPDFVRDANWNVVQKMLHLPGGVVLTINPQQTGNAQKQYSLPSAQGHTLLTVNAAGVNTSTGNGPLSSFTYDPFGNILTGSTNPANVLGASYGYGGPAQRMTETSLALMPIQMGARVYLPTLGRFTSVDPIEGGTANNYVYALDPINSNDYSGQSLFGNVANWVKKHVVVIVAVVVIVVAVVVAIVQPETIPAMALAISRAANAIQGAVSRAAPTITKVAESATKGVTKVEEALPKAQVTINIGSKIEGQMVNRGWTPTRIQEAISNPGRIVKTMDTRFDPSIGSRLNGPATAFYHQAGGYVVRNDLTGDIVQIENLFKDSWKTPW